MPVDIVGLNGYLQSDDQVRACINSDPAFKELIYGIQEQMILFPSKITLEWQLEFI